MSGRQQQLSRPRFTSNYSHIASAIIPVASIAAVPYAGSYFPVQKTRGNEGWGPVASTILHASVTSQMLVPSTSSRSSLNETSSEAYQTTSKKTITGRIDASTDGDDSDNESDQKYKESLRASTIKTSPSRTVSISESQKRLFGHATSKQEPPETKTDQNINQPNIAAAQKKTIETEISQSTTTDDNNTKRPKVKIIQQYVPPLIQNPVPSQSGPSPAKATNQVTGVGEEAKSTTTTTARSSLNDATTLPASARSVSFKEPLVHENYPSSSESRPTNTVILNQNDSVLEKLVLPPPHEYQPSFDDLEKRNELLNDEVQQLQSINRKLQIQQEELLVRLENSQRLSQQELNELLKQAGRDQTKDLQNSNNRLQNRCDQLQRELIALREQQHAQDLTPTSTKELKRENQHLKDYMIRLNAALSEYQTKYLPNSFKENMNKEHRSLRGLPEKGPTPIWLLNEKFLSPLFICYDEKLAEKDAFIKRLQNQLNEIMDSVKNITNENALLYERLNRSPATPVVNPTSTYLSDMENVKRQAILVLEENKALQEQLNLQTSKLTDLQRAQIQDVSELQRRLTMIESEKAEADRLVNTLRLKNEELRKRYEQLFLDNDHRIHIDDHMREISEMNRLTDDLIKKHASEMQLILRRVQEAENMKKVAQLQLVEARNEIQRIKNDASTTKKMNRKLLVRVTTFEKKIELEQMKEQRTTTMLEKANEEIENYKFERENFAKMLKIKDDELNQMRNQLLDEAKKTVELETRLDEVRNRNKEYGHDVQEQLKIQNENLKMRCSEHEKNIQQLKTILNQKQIIIDDLNSEKRNLEVELETMWRTTHADNIRMRQHLLEISAVN